MPEANRLVVTGCFSVVHGFSIALWEPGGPNLFSIYSGSGDFYPRNGINTAAEKRPLNNKLMVVKKQTDENTLSGLKVSDNKAYTLLYTFYYPSVKNFICKNNGTEEDAKDIFQETILVLLQKVPKEDFDLRSSLKTYIFAISSNLWLKRLRDTNKLVRTELTIYERYLADYEEAEQREADTSRGRITKVLNVFKRVSDKCRLILTAIFYDKKDIETVTKEFGYTNKHNAQNQKYKCLEQARKGADNL